MSTTAFRILAFASFATILGCGIWMQTRVHLNHDVAWITHGAGWLLEGRQFGRDIIDVNPPLIWYVSLPAAWLVKLGACGEAEAIRAYVWTLCVASLLLCHRLMRPQREAGNGLEAYALLTGAALAMAVFPGAAFAQREHLAFVLGLPYCLLAASRWQGTVPSRALAITVGALAGIGFGFKPWFLAVPLLLEISHLAHTRRWRDTWRPETVALAAVLFAYLLAVVLFAPDYLRVVVPMGAATYWAYDGSVPAWNFLEPAAVPACLALALFAMARRFPSQALALSAALAGFAFSHWAQRKGFAYHAFPALAVSLTLFCYAAGVAARSLRQLRLAVSSPVKTAMAACLLLVAGNFLRIWVEPVTDWLTRYDARTGSIGMFRAELIARIDAALPRGGYVYAFSSHPFPAFPTLSYTAAEWASPMVAQYGLPAFFARAQVQDPVRLAALDRAVQAQRDQVLRDFTAHSPDLVLLQTGARMGIRGKVDDIAFYSEDPRFAEIWRHYAEVRGLGSLRVFMRRN
jgi:hypothetical protein